MSEANRRRLNSRSEKRKVTRPGISPETLKLNGIKRVSPVEAKQLVGCMKAGLIIPYLNPQNGKPLKGDAEFREYARLRLERPKGDKKYHQAQGSKVHGYVSKSLYDLIYARDKRESHSLVLVEGEFKALALCEAGIPAIGVSGFFGCHPSGKPEKLVVEIQHVLNDLNPDEVIFLGDTDTTFNYQFSQAANRLSEAFSRMMPSRSIRLARIPYGLPKGIDDVKEQNPEEFLELWKVCLDRGFLIGVKDDVPEIALKIFEIEREMLARLVKSEPRRVREIKEEIVRLGSAAPSSVVNELKGFAKKELGMPMGEFKEALKERRQKLAEKERQQKQEKLSEFEIFYDHGRKDYCVRQDERFIRKNESSVSRDLYVTYGLSHSGEGGAPSENDEKLVEIQRKHSVEFAGAVAGYQTGLHEYQGNRFLVTQGPKLIEPVEGDCDMLWEIIENSFLEGQANYIHHWIKRSYEILVAGQRAQGQALALCGKRETNKSLLLRLITEILGGRAASPYQYMTGETTFNQDLVGAEHWTIDDENGSIDMRARRKLAATIKQTTVGQGLRVHGKGRDAILLDPFIRLSISCNDDPEALRVLPMISDDIADKIMLLRSSRYVLPMPTESPSDREAFWNQLVAEIPGYLHWLTEEVEIPSKLSSPRFGIKAFHHPEILSALTQLSPEGQLLEIIDSTCFGDNESEGEVSGSATEIESKLRDLVEGDYHLEYRINRILKFPGALGTYLGRLKSSSPNRISSKTRRGTTVWKVLKAESK